MLYDTKNAIPIYQNSNNAVSSKVVIKLRHFLHYDLIFWRLLLWLLVSPTLTFLVKRTFGCVARGSLRKTKLVTVLLFKSVAKTTLTKVVPCANCRCHVNHTSTYFSLLRAFVFLPVETFHNESNFLLDKYHTSITITLPSCFLRQQLFTLDYLNVAST